MKDFQKTLKELRELSTISEETKAFLEKMTGKELVDYESINALVGALMTHYNGELKKKAQTSHNHDERYYTEGEIDTKFKNLSLVPVPVGGILLMYNTSNPAELYRGTTWELLPADKYLKTSNTPLQQGGSNSINISKSNLPNITLRVNSFSVTTQQHSHMVRGRYFGFPREGADVNNEKEHGYLTVKYGETGSYQKDTFPGGGQNTGTASPATENLGSGIPISINPTYITIRGWKRLS